MISIADLAARAPVPIFPLVGAGARERVQDLLLREELQIAASPRHASILLVAGRLPPTLYEPAARVHDQIPSPRATALWLSEEEASAAFPSATQLPDDDPITSLLATFEDLMRGRRDSEEPILPDEPPTPWKGVGPHGQGGEGMMGGKPFGRPMAQMGHGRDGLMLDEVPLRVGPFLPGFPPGFCLDLTLRGDIVEGVSTAPNPFSQKLSRSSVFDRAKNEPVKIAEFERKRAEHHLRIVADALHVLGMVKVARRLLEMAVDGDWPVSRIVRTRKLARSSLRWAARDLGRLTRDDVDGKGLGWVARSSGLAEDARLDDPSYLSLGFEPITHDRGDALGRFQQLLDEAVQSIELARSAGDVEVSATVEDLHGVTGGGASPHLLSLIPHLVEGLEWSDALVTIMSLGIDLEDASTVDPVEIRT